MRNSSTEHNLPVMRPQLRTLPWVTLMLLFPLALSGDEDLRISREDMVAIHADRAWEDIEPDTVHFEGHFKMQVRGLLVNADRVTLYGKLDNPDRLELQGSPARFHLSHTQGNRMEDVAGEALEIVYQRESELISLNGTARLVQGENVLQSSEVEYDIKSNRFRAKGATGVHINIPTPE